MATRFVDSNASGANDGTSWTDAYTTLGAATINAGDEIRVEYRHAEAPSSSTTYTFPTGTPTTVTTITSRDKDASDAYRSNGATWTVGAGFNDITLQGAWVYLYGLTFDLTTNGADDIFYFNDNNSWGAILAEECTFKANDDFHLSASNVSTGKLMFQGCTIEAAADGMRFQGRGSAEFIDCSITGKTSAQVFEFTDAGANEGTEVVLRACDILGSSYMAGPSGLLEGHNIRAYDCSFPSGFTCYSGSETNALFNSDCLLERCANGNISNAVLGLTEYSLHGIGTCKSVLTERRTGGADDGEQANAHSWSLSCYADDTTDGVFGMRTPPIAAWVDGGTAITVTVYVASDATLQDDEVWMEVFGPRAATATARAQYNTTRSRIHETATNLTTDGTSTWTGSPSSGVATKQKMSVTWTPAEPGPVYAIVQIARGASADTVFVDPKLEIT